MTRAEFLRLAMASMVGLGLSGTGRAADAPAPAPAPPKPMGPMHTRPIPSSGEALPVIGVGTWQTFDAGPDEAERAPLRETLKVLFAAGGTVIDSSPMYGRSEAVAGELLSELKAHDRAFVATKVWTRGREEGISQMRKSMELLRDPRIELMQIHNLVDWRTHMKTLRGWKSEGLIRYLGITHYTASAFGELEAIMRAEPLDFVQFNYSLADRAAEQRLLPLAAERGIAVLVNQPFGGGGLLRSLSGTPLPGWASEIDCSSWPQILLKYVLGHPAVTCVIPGTAKPGHMMENCHAGTGIVPDGAMQKTMAAWWKNR
ncbi:aldo/keto reductase [Noviherbaspirillum sp. 17J57-3]|uniref:Aldo/keto reductase n=2 Tax=Noviherbaspirillum galbum TaxID=2709383 RepID=A0A6B3SH30_9BURK|nr:aldo/keto reductase [Noviherbaspirillum galbum]